MLVALAAATVSACEWSDKPKPAGSATVEAVVDGDTVILNIGDVSETARLIGIDTPETVDRDKPVECFGPEASAIAAELLPKGTAVRLERDVEARDGYNRLLLYVFRESDDLFINAEIARRGGAYELFIEPNTARRGDVADAIDEARNAARGLWSACPAR